MDRYEVLVNYKIYGLIHLPYELPTSPDSKIASPEEALIIEDYIRSMIGNHELLNPEHNQEQFEIISNSAASTPDNLENIRADEERDSQIIVVDEEDPLIVINNDGDVLDIQDEERFSNKIHCYDNRLHHIFKTMLSLSLMSTLLN